ncbi:MAG: L-lactate permease [Planctomycetes bacterium]|nr:L-lactate permease [Planctomycetota bacterium]
MLWAYQQYLDPLADKVFWSRAWSTLFAALPVLVLFYLLVVRRWLAPKAGAAAAATALVLAVVVYGMPAGMAGMAFFYGVGFGLLPVGWTIFNAMLLYNITVRTGQFDIGRRSIAGLSGDARIQAILIGFSFGAFLEGSAGGGTPVAICGAIMVGLGFDPFLAAVLCLIANTSPVAYGGLGTPIIVLGGVTDLPADTLSIMAGHQLPLLSLVVPLYMVKCMCSWRQTFAVWPALLVAGGSFSLFQLTFATIHAYEPSLVLWPMTDIGGGMFSLIVTAIFLRYWKPKEEFRFPGVRGQKSEVRRQEPEATRAAEGPHAAEAALTSDLRPLTSAAEKPLTVRSVSLAWAPWVLMSVLLLLTGLVRQMEEDTKTHGPRRAGGGFVRLIDPLHTNYQLAIPWLHEEVTRDPRLLEEGRPSKPESAFFNLAWLTAPGTAVFLAAMLSIPMLRMSRADVAWSFRRTFVQMRIPIPTICFMLGLSYVTRYAGMDATLGVAFAATGMMYPFFAAILGWLGVFLTGTDAGSNALFGSLQKITATEIHKAGAFAHLDLSQAQVLICTANSTGGVMGKMIDAQSIVVATAATNQLGREADIFKAVVWHSILLASIVGVIVLLQAYLVPFTLLVPRP